MIRAICALLTTMFSFSLAFGAEITGQWAMSANAPDGRTYRFELTIQGTGQLTGSIQSPDLGRVPVESVAFGGGELAFKISHPEARFVTFKLRLNGDALNGTLVTADGDAGTVTGSRKASIAGTWNVSSKAEDGSVMKLTLELRQNEGRLSGEVGNDEGSVPISNGELAGNEFKLKITVEERTYSVSGTVATEQLKGVYKSSDGENGKFTASRVR